MHNPCPPLDPATIAWLDKTYPERSPRRGTPVETIWFEAGAREVVRNLLIELERQNTINVSTESTKSTKAVAPARSSSDPRNRTQGTRP